MHGGRDLLPARDLLFRMNAGRADVADALRAHLRRLGDDETGAGAVRERGGGEWIGHVALDGAAPRHRCEHHAVVQRKLAQSIRRQQALVMRGTARKRGFRWIDVHDLTPGSVKKRRAASWGWGADRPPGDAA